MAPRRNIMLLLLSAATLVSACSTPALERGRKSDLAPPVIGAQKDNLRLGKAPPAKASEIKINSYDANAGTGAITKIRASALREAAQSYGSQRGYDRRAWEILGRLEARSSDLSQVYDFNRVASSAPVKAGVIIPPVVSRSFDAFTVDAEGREASIADEYLTIIRPGKIASHAPTWRDYLIFSAPTPKEPARSLLPSGPSEMTYFKEEFAKGFEAGIKLADAEFESRLARLKQDYQGMLQYRRLVAIGAMDKMVLADADFGVTESGNEMRIGSSTVKIVNDAEFQSDPTRWKVRAVTARDALIVETGEIPGLTEQR